MLRNTSTGYGRIAIAFHWTMAVLIIGMLGLGLYMHQLPPTEQATFELYQLHKSIGFVVADACRAPSCLAPSQSFAETA